MTSDPLFQHIEQMHGARAWGRVLDAGTGSHSLRWICSLPTTGWTAVTIDTTRVQSTLKGIGGSLRDTDAMVLGDWTDPTLLQGERFDTVLVDYLIGAIDVFTPYFQGQVLARLLRHVRDRIYVIGLEPFPAQTPSIAGQFLIQLAQMKSACRLLSGQRAFREFPAKWVERQLEQSGYKVEDTKHFPNVFRERYVRTQCSAIRRALQRLNDRNLAKALEANLQSLETQLLNATAANNGIRLSSDYVITASRVEAFPEDSKTT
jgi:hypothetical protein